MFNLKILVIVEFWMFLNNFFDQILMKFDQEQIFIPGQIHQTPIEELFKTIVGYIDPWPLPKTLKT